MLPSVQKREAAAWAAAALLLVLLIALPTLSSAALPYALLLLLVFFARVTIHIVKDYERLVVFRMGHCIGALGPGMVLVIPFVDSYTRMDQRERPQEVPHESCITKDNARIDVDFLYYWKIVNPEQAVNKVNDLDSALRGLATSLLRAVIGEITLDDALAEREHINQVLREKIDEITEHWGIEVTTVEIREIVMPEETQEIMTKQMSAERTKRAMILEAEGYRQAKMLRAQGEAEALRLLQEAACQVGNNTMALKYLETLNHLGEGQSTKYIFPLEFVDMLRPLVSSLGGAGSSEPPIPAEAPSEPAASPTPADGNGHAQGNGHKNEPVPIS